MKPPSYSRLLNKNNLITFVGVICFVFIMLANGSSENVTPYGLQFSLLYLGTAFLIWGLGGGWKPVKALLDKIPRSEMLLLGSVLLLSLVLRLWELGTKVRIPVDEVLPMTEILALWDNPNLPIIGQFGFISSPTRLFASWQAASVALVGHNLLALRIPSAIIGTLTVAAVYCLGRVLFDRRIAIIAALLLATYPPHLHFSRIGLLSIADPLFGTLTLAFIVLAFKSNLRMAWVLGGVALGLTQYFYEGGRLLYPALIIIWIIFTLLSHRKQIASWARGLLLCGVTTCIIAVPVYYTLARLNDPLSSRMNALAISGNDWRAILTSPPDSPVFDWLVRHTIDPFLLFINRPDSTSYYGGSTALILFFLVPTFVLGLLWSVKSAGGRLLLLWFLLAWAGNLLMVDSALAARYVVVFPAVALLMAVGIVQTAIYLPTQHRFMLVGAYLAFCVVAQPFYYFGQHLENYNQQLAQGRDACDALFRAAALPSGTSVYIVYPPSTMAESYAQTLLRFLSDDKTLHFIEAPDKFDFSRRTQASNYAFFVPVDDTNTMALMEQYFDFAVPQYSPYPLSDEQAYVLYLTAPKSSDESS